MKGTRATHGKLRRSLDGLESFLASDNVGQVVDSDEQRDLRHAQKLIWRVESRLFEKVGAEARYRGEIFHSMGRRG